MFCFAETLVELFSKPHVLKRCSATGNDENKTRDLVSNY